MRLIPFKVKMEAVKPYFNSLSTNEIIAKTGVSEGAVISIFKDEAEEYKISIRLYVDDKKER